MASQVTPSAHPKQTNLPLLPLLLRSPGYFRVQPGKRLRGWEVIGPQFSWSWLGLFVAQSDGFWVQEADIQNGPLLFSHCSVQTSDPMLFKCTEGQCSSHLLDFENVQGRLGLVAATIALLTSVTNGMEVRTILGGWDSRVSPKGNGSLLLLLSERQSLSLVGLRSRQFAENSLRQRERWKCPPGWSNGWGQAGGGSRQEEWSPFALEKPLGVASQLY